MPVEAREGYQQSIVRAAVPGASYFVLVFDAGSMPPTDRRTRDGRRVAEVVSSTGRSTDPSGAHSREHSGRQSDADGVRRRGYPRRRQRPQSMGAWLLSAHLG